MRQCRYSRNIACASGLAFRRLWADATSPFAIYSNRTPDAEARPLAKRYTDELLQQEDSLATLRKDLDALNPQRQVAQQELGNKVDTLTLDESL